MSKNNNSKKMLMWLKRTLLLKEKLFSEKPNAINIFLHTARTECTLLQLFSEFLSRCFVSSGKNLNIFGQKI